MSIKPTDDEHLELGSGRLADAGGALSVNGAMPGAVAEQIALIRAEIGLTGTGVLDELVASYGPGTPYNLTFSIGGQIGIDCAPVGWDKTFCLQFLPEAAYPTIHFFGDKTAPGGGDHELYEHVRTIGHTVTSPEHTLELVEQLFLA